MLLTKSGKWKNELQELDIVKLKKKGKSGEENETTSIHV